MHRILSNRRSKLPFRTNLKSAGVFALVVTFAMCGAAAQAQQAKKIHRIGLLSFTRYDSITEEFRQALQARGYNEGKDIVIEYRYAEGNLDRLPVLAAELVSLKVDLIVVISGQAARAAKQATTTIPIVMAISGDVVGPELSQAYPIREETSPG